MTHGKFLKTLAVLTAAILLLTALTPAVFAADAEKTIEERAHENALNRLARAVAADGSVLPQSVDPDGRMKIIVSLEDTGAPGGAARKNAPARLSAEQLRADVKARIEALDGGSAAPGRKGAPKKSAVEFGYDYDVLLNGFAVTAPSAYLDEIRAMDGVREAFPARTYYPLGEPAGGYENDLSQNYVGADAAHAAGYTGKGRLIAILDTGIDSSHPAFAETAGVTASPRYTLAKMKTLFSAETLRAEQGGAKAAAVYRSAKLPFVFNYVSKKTDVSDGVGHGTHVAGIAAGDATETMIGTAPDAQIAVMKVFDDQTGGADDEALLAALEDAALLGADVVNMSLGADGGFFDYPNETTAQVYENLRARGITVAAAAGNSGMAPGNGSPAPTNDPTISLVADPSTYAAAISVASVDNYLSDAIVVGGRTVLFTDGIHTDADEKILTVSPRDLTLDRYSYVDCGFGAKNDFDGVSLAGEIALISRGGREEDGELLTFSAKANAASAAGAAAVVVYNNVPGELIAPYVIFDAAAPIPVIFISQDDGAYLKETAVKTLSFRFGEEMVTGVSGFSSWGPTGDLRLKPEIAAVGGSVYSAIPGGGYEKMDGTSMATPQLAGMAALLRQHLTGAGAPQTDLSAAALTETLLMNTAAPMADADGFYSPLKQGAGVANVKNALGAKACLTVEGSARPKAELGDGIDREPKSFTFTVTNFTGEPLSYTLSANALAQDAYATEDGIFFKENSVDLLGRGVTVVFGGDAADGVLTVPANGSASVTATVSAGAAAAEYAASIGAAQGMFLDGFIRLTADEASGADLGLPYLSFFGDWDAVTLIRDIHPVGGTELNALLGVDIFGTPPEAGELPAVLWDKFAVSPVSSFSNQLVTLTDLSKNSSMRYELKDKSGRVLFETSRDSARKSFYMPAAQSFFFPEMEMDPLPTVPFTDDKGKSILQDGETYTLTVYATPLGGAGEQSRSFDIRCDADIPTVDYSVVGDGKTLCFSVGDKTALAGFGVFGALDQQDAELSYSNFSGMSVCAGDYFDIRREGENAFSVNVDLVGLLAQMHREGKDPRYLVIAAADYAMNETDVVVDLVHEGAEGSVPCNYCGKYHTGFLGRFVRFFHNILYFFKKLFGG
ncbi:MAG: S8 family serine peptidase [Clostridia bacterium]|nr:S8 family serine peptidase [Clostridia bacterium]